MFIKNPDPTMSPIEVTTKHFLTDAEFARLHRDDNNLVLAEAARRIELLIEEVNVHKTFAEEVTGLIRNMGKQQ
jgi:uncharacterized lipoprotein YajG